MNLTLDDLDTEIDALTWDRRAFLHALIATPLAAALPKAPTPELLVVEPREPVRYTIGADHGSKGWGSIVLLRGDPSGVMVLAEGQIALASGTEVVWTR